MGNQLGGKQQFRVRDCPGGAGNMLDTDNAVTRQAQNAEHPILIVEDDPDISALLASFLRERGFVIFVAHSAETATEILEGNAIDLVLLDVMLPGESGLALCKHLRSGTGPSVILVTALSELSDKVAGLELGADDYVTKPFDLEELLARIHAVLRRSTPAAGVQAVAGAEKALCFSGYSFFAHRRFLRSPEGLRIPLTGAETDLLLIFCQHPREVLSRQELIRLTRDGDNSVSTRSIDLLVSRLRRKLSGDDPFDNPIRTVRADGYAFEPEVRVE